MRVDGILESSEVYRQGVRYDDRLIEFAGRKVTTVNQFKNVLGIFPKGWRVPVKFEHDGEILDTFIRLQGVHADGELAKLVSGNKNPPQRPKPKKSQPGKPSKPVPNQKLPDETKKQLEANDQTPAEYENLFEKRNGFVNYYFNRMNQNRVWGLAVSDSDYGNYPKSWKLIGQNSQGTKVEIVLGDEQSGIKSGDDAFVLNMSDDLTEQAKENSNNAFLLALQQWRKMLQLGPSKFGQSTYWGEVPSAEGDQMELIVATRNILESNLLFDTNSGQLRWFESYLDTDRDPCTLEFSNYQTKNGLLFPTTVAYQIGAGKAETISIETFELGKVTKNNQDSNE